MSRITLHDVARLAGVSVRTVSNVANDFVHVAPATRIKVQRAIDELGYRPNIAARRLRQGQRILVSLVLPEMDSPYFSDIAARAVRAGEKRGWIVHMEQTDGLLERERAMLRGDHGPGADAIIFCPWSMSVTEAAPPPGRPPIVTLGERSGMGLVDHIAVDNIFAAEEATRHLSNQGRSVIAALGLQSHLSNETARLRQLGYHNALKVAGFKPDISLEMEVDRLHHEDGATGMRRLLARRPDIDAVFAFTDQLALGAMYVLADQGYRVPDDVAVIGFDDIEGGRYSVPALSTIAPDKAALVDAALDCIAKRLDAHDRPAEERIVEHVLKIRGSTVRRTVGSR